METTYDKQSEPDYKERSCNWKTAIGLQQVDGLVPTKYLVELANQNINGELSIEEVRLKIQNYYDNKSVKTDDEKREKEADLVSQRIAELLSLNAFTLSTVQLIAIHKYLFESIYDFAGKIRNFNISKKEYILEDASVEYGNSAIIAEMLEHNIQKEKKFNYQPLDKQKIIEHFAEFISDLWQIYPFAEGNTRTTAVFVIKYLRSFGYNIGNETFGKHSWYFRNALVRANYQNAERNIFKTNVPLIKFLKNLLLNEQNELKNRELHINATAN